MGVSGILASKSMCGQPLSTLTHPPTPPLTKWDFGQIFFSFFLLSPPVQCVWHQKTSNGSVLWRASGFIIEHLLQVIEVNYIFFFSIKFRHK